MNFFRSSTRTKGKHLESKRYQYRTSVESLEQRCLLSADMVVQWNAIAIEAAKRDYSLAPGYQIGPTRLGRAMAIVQAAVYDAVNSIDPQYKPYLIQIAAPSGTSMDAAVAQAAHDTLVAMFPNQQAYFDSELASSLAGIATHAGRGRGGRWVGGCQLHLGRASKRRLADRCGRSAGQFHIRPAAGPVARGPSAPRCDTLDSRLGQRHSLWDCERIAVLAAPAADAYSLAYATAYEEVKAMGALNSTIRTPDQTQIAFFWGYDAQPGLCAPIRFYNQIAEVIAQQQGNSEVANARFFALTNIAMADGGIVSWDAKYLYDFWRPITAIRENDPGTGPSGLGSGNPYLVGQGDPSWQPLGAPAHNGGGNFTPPFPTYTSGHATIGARALQDDGRFLRDR